MSKLQIKLKRSLIRRTKKQIGTVNALGLKKIGEVVEHSKSPEIVGMINKVSFLLDVKEV